MYLEPNNPSLSFADFLDAAIRDKAETKPFPYTLEVCRCRLLQERKMLIQTMLLYERECESEIVYLC